MLTSLSASNFKSWREIPPMRLAPITGLFGANSSGKTSILQLLLMLRQTVESPDRAQVLNLGGGRSLVSLGTFDEVVYRHDHSAPLAWRIEWSLPHELRIANPEAPMEILFAGRTIGFSARVREGARDRL